MKLREKTRPDVSNAAPRRAADLMSVPSAHRRRETITASPALPWTPEADRGSRPRVADRADEPTILDRLLRRLAKVLQPRDLLSIPLLPEGGHLEGSFRYRRLHAALARPGTRLWTGHLGPQRPPRNRAA